MIGRSQTTGASEAAQLLDLLDAERQLLADGRLGELGALVARREQLAEAVLAAPERLPAGFLDSLRAKAERNGRLLVAARAGLRAARAQLAAAETARKTLRTYTAAGTPVEVAAATATRDHRR